MRLPADGVGQHVSEREMVRDAGLAAKLHCAQLGETIDVIESRRVALLTEVGVFLH